MSSEYEQFVASKLTHSPPTGLADVPEDLGPHLFPFQRDLTRWALRRGRAAIFADTGLGKSRMELTWAREVRAATGRDVLILCPLAVAAQTHAEGVKCGIAATVCRDGAEPHAGIALTNYERLHRFDVGAFGGVVLDESSRIKHSDAKGFRLLTDAFAQTPFRLCATATPAPNDWTELGTHAEFLGACSRAEMLAEFFCHDGGETQVWRLKGHARAAFWKWVASWAALVRHPRDLGYEMPGYDLPPLETTQHTVAADDESVKRSGMLFPMEARDLTERRRARRASIDARVAACAARVNADAEAWVVWCELNDESDALAAAIPGSVEVRGSMSIEEKEAALAGFAAGSVRVLISKTSISGWGLNWQHAARMAFVGVSDSFESYYQAVRREWRFGQTRPVRVHLYASELEGAVVANLARKERDAAAMAAALSVETRDAVRAAVRGLERSTNLYEPAVPMVVPPWLASGPDDGRAVDA